MTLLEPLLHVWLKLQSNNKTHEHSFASNHIMLHVTRSRRIALPVLAVAACTPLFFASVAFIGPSNPLTLLSTKDNGRVVNVGMNQYRQGPCKKKIARSPKNPNQLSVKEKQSQRSKARLSSADKEKGKGLIQWPVEIPEGITILHVEYDVAPTSKEAADWAKRSWSAFPRPGNKEIQDFYKKIQESFGPKVRIIVNEPRLIKEIAMKELLPEGLPLKYRKGSFEVVNLNTGKLLFSKLQTGSSVVYEVWRDLISEESRF
eukprot:symbB.v1.2.026385.t1/scaffold2559.1/size125745/4